MYLRYCIDTMCPYVVVTDYRNSVLLHIKESGVSMRMKKMVKKRNVTPIIDVQEDGSAPCYLLLGAAVLRMEEAGLLTYNS